MNLSKKENESETNVKNETIILQGEVYENLQDLHLKAVPVQIKQILKKLHNEENVLFFF